MTAQESKVSPLQRFLIWLILLIAVFDFQSVWKNFTSENPMVWVGIIDGLCLAGVISYTLRNWSKRVPELNILLLLILATASFGERRSEGWIISSLIFKMIMAGLIFYLLRSKASKAVDTSQAT